MSEKIDWNVTARVAGGPMVAASGSTKADAYDKIEVTIPTGATQAVDIAPGNWTSVLFLALNPAQPSDKLSYKANGSDIVVDGPHFLVGAGAVALLGTGAVNLSFTNGSASDAQIDILVGRKVP